MLCIYFRIRWHIGQERTCCWLDLVANDPDLTRLLRQMTLDRMRTRAVDDPSFGVCG